MSGYLIRLFHSSPFGLDYIFNPMFSNKNTIYSATEIYDAMELFENTEFLDEESHSSIQGLINLLAEKRAL